MVLAFTFLIVATCLFQSHLVVLYRKKIPLHDKNIIENTKYRKIAQVDIY